MKLRTLLAMLLAATLIVVPLAVAEKDRQDDKDEQDDHRDEGSREGKDDDHDGDRDGRLEHRKQKVHVDVDGHEAHIKMARDDGATEEKIKVRYVAEAGTMKVSYETENATVESETELKVRFREVLEFRDLDGDGAYDANETVVARHKVDSLDWRIVGPEPVNASSGAPGQRITGIGEFPEGGALVFALYVYGDFATVNGTSLMPTSVKIDILLDHFPFQANDTLVALLGKTEQEREIEVQGGDAELVAAANGLQAYFSWADNATVDNVSRPVRTTILKSSIDEGGKETIFAFAYARGTLVNHDPVLGIQSAGSEARSVPALPLAGVLAGVAVLAWSRRRA